MHNFLNPSLQPFKVVPFSPHFANEASSLPAVLQQEVVKSDSSAVCSVSKNKQPGFMQTLWSRSEALVELEKESLSCGPGDRHIWETVAWTRSIPSLTA